jgi:hypothetical protein
MQPCRKDTLGRLAGPDYIDPIQKLFLDDLSAFCHGLVQKLIWAGAIPLPGDRHGNRKIVILADLNNCWC